MFLNEVISKFSKIISCVRFFKNNEIIIGGCIEKIDGDYSHNNFGDDLNIPLLESLTGKKIRLRSEVGIRRLKNILCIGSILESDVISSSIVWGSGAMYGNAMRLRPHKVYAVRGPYTRDFLIKEKINCPKIYGDPALLVPLIYNPAVEKRYKLGIIPHFVDYDLPHVARFRDKHPEVLFIQMRNYKSWKDVIDKIKSCESIASSSLHGLIVSDAYGIPNTYIKLSNQILGGDFKYRDYFAGVSRPFIDPVDCTKEFRIDSIERSLIAYQPICFDARTLLDAFPYQLLPKYKHLDNIRNL